MTRTDPFPFLPPGWTRCEGPQEPWLERGDAVIAYSTEVGGYFVPGPGRFGVAAGPFATLDEALAVSA